MEKYGVIYKATNTVNGKVYVGQTVREFGVRKKAHISRAFGSKPEVAFHFALKKYGKGSFVWNVIEECETKDELDEMEYHYIMQYDSYKKGYNRTLGGQKVCGIVMSDETKKKMSIRMKGKFVGEKNPFYGKKHTLEAKIKISKALLESPNHPTRGKHLSEEHRQNIGLANKGRETTIETRLKISKSKIGKLRGMDSKYAKKYIVTTSDGNEFCVLGLGDFCRKYKDGLLDVRLLSKVVFGKRNHHRHHKCRHYNEEADKNIPNWSEEEPN